MTQASADAALDAWIEIVGEPLRRVLTGNIYDNPQNAAENFGVSLVEIGRFIAAADDPDSTALYLARGAEGTSAWLQSESPGLFGNYRDAAEGILEEHIGHLELFAIYIRCNRAELDDSDVRWLAYEAAQIIRLSLNSDAAQGGGLRPTDEFRKLVAVHQTSNLDGGLRFIEAYSSLCTKSRQRLHGEALALGVRFEPGILCDPYWCLQSIRSALAGETYSAHRSELETLAKAVELGLKNSCEDAWVGAWANASWETRRIVENEAPGRLYILGLDQGFAFGGTDIEAIQFVASSLTASNQRRPPKILRDRAFRTAQEHYLALSGRTRGDWSKDLHGETGGPFVDFLRAIDGAFGSQLRAALR